MTFTRNIVWTLSNLCRNKNPPPPFEVVRTALPVLNRLLSNTDKDILGELIVFIIAFLEYTDFLIERNIFEVCINF